MKRFLIFITTVFAVILLWCLALHPAFLALYSSRVPVPHGLMVYLQSIWAGLPLDIAVSSYFTVPAFLIAVAAAFSPRGRWSRIALNIWFGIVSLFLALAFVSDLTLYKYWGFRLDATPLFYFLSSPKAAFASASAEMIIIGLGIILLLASAVWFSLSWVRAAWFEPVQFAVGKGGKWGVGLLSLLAGGALFLGIRGGFTVSTMNVSRAYWSETPILNHAAVNPVFSLLYSLSHQNDFGSQFRNMDAGDAEETFRNTNPEISESQTWKKEWINTPRPDIYIVILESFSSHLLPLLGGEPVALSIDSIGKEGLVFSDFYANSFRTDRGIPAILSGFPGAPTVSLMKDVAKTEHLPSLARELRRGGYRVNYYYGGDINFTNMLAYLRNAGFERFVSDADFPMSQKLSKWGAHDDVMLEKVVEKLKERRKESDPQFHVVQTSSSHEPFDVPYKGRFGDGPRNAFEFTDHCVARFAREVKELQGERPWIMILVPDHYGAYPRNPENEVSRHRIPMIMTGNALAKRGVVDVTGSQADIAPTILNILGLPGASGFVFGHDLSDGEATGGAFVSQPDFYGWIGPEGNAFIETANGSPRQGSDSVAVKNAKAYIQVMYDYMDKL